MFGTGLRFLVLLVLCCSTAAAGPREAPYRVVILHSFRTTLPINAGFATGITRGLMTMPGGRVEIDIESLDMSRFDDEIYVGKLIDVFRLKYRDHPPDLIMPTYSPALGFLLDHGESIFPGVPMVFVGPELSFLTSRKLPSNVTGIAGRRDFTGTLELMARLHPGLRQVALVVGAGRLDQQWEADAREALRPYEGRFAFTWLRGMPLRELADAVRALPPGSAILYLGQFADRDGRAYVPRNVAAEVATAASVPTYGLWDTLIGTGIVGGRLATVENISFAAGQLGVRVLLGEPPSAIPVDDDYRTQTILDGRQLDRWGIPDSRLPESSQVLFREPSLWEEHQRAIIGIALVIAFQCLLIVALLANRARLRRTQSALRDECDQRLRAESMASRLGTRLANFSKQSALGALATGIAHEVSQPLTAIKNYAQAARRYAAREVPDRTKLDELLGEMEGEASRAGGIVQKIRSLVSTGAVQPVPVALQAIVDEVLNGMQPELAGQGCRVVADLEPDLPPVLADALQVQLVLVNLLHNAMESLSRTADGPGTPISITAALQGDREVEVRVADCGPGIPAEAAEEIFDPLFSTKPTGMGVGLATCRTIVQAHGGRIWCAPNPSGGAIFLFTLPVARRHT